MNAVHGTRATGTALQRLASRLGHGFANPDLLTQACTHRSCGHKNNERLEFLGDALLNFVVGATLFERRQNLPEGDLSRLRSSLVREETLAELARQLDLGDALRLGAGELRSGGFRRDSILADALEAVLGAVYCDAGFEVARDVCLSLFAPLLGDLPDPRSLKDAKTRLQERLQAVGRPLPEYAVVDESGPPHRRSFTVSCRLDDDAAETQAYGSSRKHAEQDAAAAMIERLEAGDA